MVPFNKLLKDISSQNWGTGCYELLATTQGRDCSYSWAWLPNKWHFLCGVAGGHLTLQRFEAASIGQRMIHAVLQSVQETSQNLPPNQDSSSSSSPSHSASTLDSPPPHNGHTRDLAKTYQRPLCLWKELSKLRQEIFLAPEKICHFSEDLLFRHASKGAAFCAQLLLLQVNKKVLFVKIYIPL